MTKSIGKKLDAAWGNVYTECIDGIKMDGLYYGQSRKAKAVARRYADMVLDAILDCQDSPEIFEKQCDFWTQWVCDEGAGEWCYEAMQEGNAE